MLRYAAKRLISLLLSLAVASLGDFCSGSRLRPVIPLHSCWGTNAQPDTLAALREEPGFWINPRRRDYLSWISGMLSGDFGTSLYIPDPGIGDDFRQVAGLAAARPLCPFLVHRDRTASGHLCSLLVAGKPRDLAVMGATQLGVAIPNFWFAMMLVLIFAINLRWFGAGGFAGWENGLLTGLHSLTLPAIALALPQAAILTRVMRSALLDILGEDFIRTARAKGLSNRQALWRHGLRNALIPVLTIIGLQFSFLLAGSIIDRTGVFTFPVSVALCSKPSRHAI